MVAFLMFLRLEVDLYFQSSKLTLINWHFLADLCRSRFRFGKRMNFDTTQLVSWESSGELQGENQDRGPGGPVASHSPEERSPDPPRILTAY